jgi:hypothetical protein
MFGFRFILAICLPQILPGLLPVIFYLFLSESKIGQICCIAF